jgi:hypothetical protein
LASNFSTADKATIAANLLLSTVLLAATITTDLSGAIAETAKQGDKS